MVAGAVVGVVGLALGTEWIALVGLILAVTAAGALAATLLVAERHEDKRVEEELERLSTEHALLSDQLITAEQEERRRLALYLHDTSVQSLSAIALMLDASLHRIETGELEDATSVIGSALERHRATIGALRDLSFNLEPVVLRDQGFEPAVRALAEAVGLDRGIQIDVEVEGIDALPEKAQAALYQIVRESVDAAARREPERVFVSVGTADDGSLVATVRDDGRAERRRAIFDGLQERARTLTGSIDVHQGHDGGTTVRLTIPPYAAGR